MTKMNPSKEQKRRRFSKEREHLSIPVRVRAFIAL
jgi:hypothetical protein